MRVKLPIDEISNELYDAIYNELKESFGNITDNDEWELTFELPDRVACNCGAPTNDQKQRGVCSNCNNILWEA